MITGTRRSQLVGDVQCLFDRLQRALRPSFVQIPFRTQGEELILIGDISVFHGEVVT